MKMKILISLTLFLLTLNSIAQKLELKTTGERITFEVGETINLKLTILELNGKLNVESSENITTIDLRELKKTITVIFDKEGKYTIGPYEFELKDKKIKSNSIKVYIAKSSSTNPIQDTLIEIIAPDDINKGDTFEIVIRSNVKLFQSKNPTLINNNSEFKIQTVQIQETKLIKQINYTHSSSFKFNNGKSSSLHFYTFKVYTLKKGKITINAESFKPNISEKVGKKVIKII